MNFHELKRRAEALLAHMECGKEYTVGHVSQRLEKAAAEHPQDVVIRAVAGVLDKMNRQNPNKIISQADMDKIYNQLIGLDVSGTKFREVLGDLLLSQKPASAAPDSKYAEAYRDPLQEAIAETKTAFGEELDSIFSPTDNHYDPKHISEASNKIGLELKSMGFNSAKIKIAGGNSRYLMFSVDFDTNRGPARTYIPVESSGNKLPSVFQTGDHFTELTKANLSSFLKEAVTKSMRPLEYRCEGEVEVPRTPAPEPLKTLAAEIEESVLESSIGHPQMAVRLAKRMLLAELAAMGFKGSQVRVSAPTSDGFICEAILNTPRGKIAIDVPIEMRENQPLMPSVFAKGDKLEDFNEINLKAMLAREPETVGIAVRRDSPLLAMDYHDLKDVLVKNAVNGNFQVCDEVMEAIAERFDQDTYKNTLLDYQKILADLSIVKRQAESRCGRILKSSNSIFPICGHFMVPLNKVIQDEDGVCHLASTYHARKNQEAEGAYFSNSKVLLGDK